MSILSESIQYATGVINTYWEDPRGGKEVGIDMEYALLDGQKFYAKDLTWEHRFVIFSCPICGNKLYPAILSETTHSFFKHGKNESCIEYGLKYTDTEFEEFEKTSDAYALLTCNGDVQLLTERQRNQLRRRGLIHIEGRHEMGLTTKALDLLETYKKKEQQ